MSLYKIRRRDALKTLAAAGGTAAGAPTLASAAEPAIKTQAAVSPGAMERGVLDQDLTRPVLLWKKILTSDELRTVAALVDLILPADARSPAPSKLGVHDFVDEWVSAPYPVQQADQQTVRGGLGWLNTASWKRFGKAFADLPEGSKQLVLADIAVDPKKAKPRLRGPATFFHRMRFLTICGFYTTVEGMKDMGYVGNVPLASWTGPPPEILKRLGLG